MSNENAVNSRAIVRRIVVRGALKLETPASFGNGEGEDLVDMPLALDPLEGRALLTGASLAGALRAYLRQRELDYNTPDGKKSLTRALFGYQEQLQGERSRDEQPQGEQSLLIVNDALGQDPASAARGTGNVGNGRGGRKRPAVELRDGDAIAAATRTAEDKKKFDFEALPAGTVFPIEIELLVREEQTDALRQALAVALEGLELGEIPLGRRKRRGLGCCRVTQWEVCDYNLTTLAGLMGWLRDDRGQAQTGPKIGPLLGQAGALMDQRSRVTLRATFHLDSSLLIRSAPAEPREPDMIHLHSQRGGQQVPILSGTSLAGALRGRALRICRTLGSPTWASAFVDDLFGPRLVVRKRTRRSAGADDEGTPHASRLTTAETEVRQPIELVQSRVKIDRFTGGSYPTALFTEQPVFGGAKTEVEVKLELHKPTDAQLGLLLFLLKDLWTADLPLGGEVSVGRGRLAGQTATLMRQAPGGAPQRWTIKQAAGGLAVTDEAGQDAQAELERFATAFLGEVKQ